MTTASQRIVRSYLALTLLSTLAASFIWGINTLFLLDAGLSITQAFTANAFFTVGQVVFELPTGVVADMVGRRASYLLGSATLFVSTLLYLLLWQASGPFWTWAVVSMLLGLGFTFFTGATEAWLVDALQATEFDGTLESVLAKGAVANGIAMLTGTVAGGVIAQATNLGVPYILRAVMLCLTFAIAFRSMHDLGFEPQKNTSLANETRKIFQASLTHGILNPRVRWLMLAAPFGGGVGMFAFYAMQPYLLELYGGRASYAIAGIAAAVVAGAQIAGGLLVPQAGKLFRRRTSVIAAGTVISAAALALMGLMPTFWFVLFLLTIWAVVFAAVGPVRQAYLNSLIPSEQRATVLSSDNLFASAGGAVAQPALGRCADVWGYPVSYIFSSIIQIIALPFIMFAAYQKAPSDVIATGENAASHTHTKNKH